MDSTRKPSSPEQRELVVAQAKRLPFTMIIVGIALVIGFTGNFPVALMVLAAATLSISRKGMDKAARRRSNITRSSSVLSAGVAVAGLVMSVPGLIVGGIVAYWLTDALSAQFALRAKDGKKPEAVETYVVRFMQLCYVGLAVLAIAGIPQAAVIFGSLFELFMSAFIWLLSLLGAASVKVLDTLEQQDPERPANGKVIQGEVIDTPRQD